MNLQIKKVLILSPDATIADAQELLKKEENVCAGLLNAKKEIKSYILKEDVSYILNFNVASLSAGLIATYADFIESDDLKIAEQKAREAKLTGFKKAVFVGQNKKNIKYLFVFDQEISSKSRNISSLFEKNIPEKIKKVLDLCSKTADKYAMPVFLVGGAVRDIIIGKQIVDTDITVQGDAVEFVHFLQKEYPEVCEIKEIHQSFKTSKMTFCIEEEKIEIDIASTRKESYAYPASLPQINETGCSLYEDIVRRDFAINSMAVSLNEQSFGDLVDYLDGYSDIQDKKLTILHSASFIDDPTRIIRALKFKVRFGCELDIATKKLQDACIASSLFDNLCGDRLKSEIKQTFNLNKPEALVEFVNEKLYRLLGKDISPPASIKKISELTKNFIQEYKDELASVDFIWLVYLGVLFSETSKEKIDEIAEHIYLSGMETKILIESTILMGKLDLIRSACTRFEVYELFEGYTKEAILICLIKNPDILEKVELYLKELQSVNICLTGKTLTDLGLKPGPVFGEIFKIVLKEKINQKIFSKEDEIKLIEKYIKRQI